MLGPCANVALERHPVTFGIDHHVAVVGDQRVAVKGVLNEKRDVDGVRVLGDVDVVLDIANAGEPGDSHLGRPALGSVSDVPVSRRLPSCAVASTPSGTVTFIASALFAAAASIGSSR